VSASDIATETTTPERRRLRLRRLALLAVAFALVAAAVLAVRSGGPKVLWSSLDGALREAGPFVFFAAMALLPAVGFPLMPFTLVAGPVFGPPLGVGAPGAGAVAAVAANVALSYWLAAAVFRTWVLRLAAWLGYRLPEMPAGTAWQLVTVVRLAPGLPFWMQSYLLGVVRAPFAAYLTLSTAIPALYIAMTITGGDALVRGRGRTALLAFAGLGFVAALVHLLRKRRAAGRASTPGAVVPPQRSCPDNRRA
jgi:uncharacterized membrane protein YdjX (TVP38/TMEM64 family)